jgi:hypothetical protein
MAARKTKWTPEIVKERIRVGVLLRLVHKQALIDLEANPKAKDVMSDKSLRAAMFLLERVAPKAEPLKQIEVTGKLTLEQLISHAATSPADSSG